MIQQRSVLVQSQPSVRSVPDSALTPSSVPDLPDDSLHQYLADIADLPRLSNGEDDRLLAQLEALKQCQAPDAEGRRIVQQLIEGSLHLVIYLAERYYRYWHAVAGYARVPLPDLIQAGNLALVRCAMRCWTEPRTPTDFSAYASAYIRHALIDAHRESGVFVLSHHELVKALHYHTLSHLYDPLSVEATRDEDDQPLRDWLPAPEITHEEDSPIKARQVAQVLASLPSLEQQILRLRYGLDEADQHEHTIAEIAHKLHLASSTCSDLLQHALQAVRDQRTLRHSPEFYSATQAAQVLGISETTFYRRVHQGLIPRHLLSPTDQRGVYRKQEIDALAQQYQQVAQQGYLTQQEVAARLHVTVLTVQKWGKKGRLTVYRFPESGPRYDRYEVEALAHEQENASHHYYTAAQAASRLGISRTSLFRWVRQGHLACYEVSGFPHERGYARQEVDALAARLQHPTAVPETMESAQERIAS
jgi:RNA polymerase sigma factor (sigma-70 family)